MNIFYQPEIPNGVRHLDQVESKHCVRVLRKKTGDSILLTDGKGFFYSADIQEANQSKCTFQITEREREPERDYQVHIAIAPTKNQDRIEWFVEKAVEIGIDKITFIECHHSKRISMKMERISKMAISAMKQSQRASLPEISGPFKFEKWLPSVLEKQRFIAHVDMNNHLHLKDSCKSGRPAIILIGPEGDFSPGEVSMAADLGFKKVSLGHARLRTETAGLVACHIINLINTH